jgi:hypothetical protein
MFATSIKRSLIKNIPTTLRMMLNKLRGDMAVNLVSINIDMFGYAGIGCLGE